MIRNPIDISSRVSTELTSFIEMILIQLESDEPVTLGAIRTFITYDLPKEMSGSEEMHHFDVDESVIDELDGLIEQFGESALAVDFINATASEALSRVIEAVMDDDNHETPSLETIKDAMLAGLTSCLIGNGVLEEEEGELLLPEIDSLIERYGADSLAEEHLHYG